jgi:TorA maturation chaperone TorD
MDIMQPGQTNELLPQQVRQARLPLADRYPAYATLYDLLSAAFSYPRADLYAALQSNVFMEKVTVALGALPDVPALNAAEGALRAAIETTLADCPLLQLESDYIALFDANRELPVVHPYARLYGEQLLNPTALLQRLQAAYREQGLELDTERGAEQPDHITVQLEFMALLFQRLAQTPDDAAALEDAKSFLSQLAWLPRFVAKLDERGKPHWLYSPLAHFLAALHACDPWCDSAAG